MVRLGRSGLQEGRGGCTGAVKILPASCGIFFGPISQSLAILLIQRIE